MFIGLDAHKATISVALAQGERGGEVRHWGTFPNRADHVRKLADKLGGGVCQRSCPPISCGVSDFRGADFVFGVESDGSGGLPVAGFA